MSRIVLARIAASVDLSPLPPSGSVGVYYDWSPRPIGVAPPYVLEFSTLPAGLDLSLSLSGVGAQINHRISGTPTTGGDFPLTIVAIGSDRIPVQFLFTIRIAVAPLILSGKFIAQGAGQPVTGSLTASGGTAPYTLVSVEGSVPGVTFTMTAGVITATGNVTTAATYWLHFNIRDSAWQLARVTYRLKVAPSTSFTYITESGDTYITESGDTYITEEN